MGRIPPVKVKRELRQEVNFGCAVCGAPLLEFHHIIPYSEVEHHDPDHMVALCPTHHRLSDDSALSRSELYDYKEDPNNSDIVDYDFYFDPDAPIIPLGSAVVEIGDFGRYTLVEINDEPIISVNYEDGRIEFDVNFYNEDNDLIAVITDNEWWADTQEFWDIKYQSNRLKLWNEKYEIGFLSEFDPEKRSISLRGRFLYDADELIIHPSSIKYPEINSSIHGGVFVLGGDEDYEHRAGTGNSTVLRSPQAHGLFAVNSEGGDFLFKM